MSRARSIRLSLAVLASSLLLNVILVSCAAKAVLPPDPSGENNGGSGADPLDNAELLARFDSVMARLTQIEAKVDQQAAQLQQQADAETAQTATLSGRIDSLASTITTQAADPVVATRQVARIDSLLALTSFIANDMASASWQVCGNIDAGLGMALSPNAELYGEAAADGGAWAGTGAFAGAEVHAGLATQLEVGMNGGVSFGGCAPMFNDAPPSRDAPMPNQAGQELQNLLDGAASQVGLTRSRVRASLSRLANGIQSAGSMRIQDAIDYLPLPTQLAAITSDPVGHISRQIPTKVDEAVQILCTRNWGSVMSATVPVACDRIKDKLFDIGGLFALVDHVSDIELAINGLQDGYGAIHGAVDGLQTGFGSIQDAVGELQSGFGGIQSTVGGLESQFGSIQSTVGGLKSGVQSMQDAFGEVTGKVNLLQTSVQQAGNAFKAVCQKIDGIGGATLTIDNPLSLGPDDLYDGQIFPFYSPIGC